MSRTPVRCDRVGRPGARRTRGAALSLTAAIACALSGCGSQVEGPDPTSPPRTFRMGFSAIPPRADFDMLLRSMDLWMQRADAAYLGAFEEPDEVPLDYNARVAGGTTLPTLVIEGGWTPASVDLISAPPPPGSILPLFAALGLVDTALAPKPALAPWDSAWARPRELH